MKKSLIPIIVLVLLVGGIFILAKSGSPTKTNTSAVNNVTIVDGKQIITINAKAGYQPSLSTAQAGIPTVVRFVTKGAFDCSSSIRIPSLNISKILPQTGNTDIDIGVPKTGTLQGTCGMGMYSFGVNFQN